MLTMLNNDDHYALEATPRIKKKKEWRCFSKVCTKDELGTSTPGIVKVPSEDDTCPDCGDYLVLKLITA